MQARARIPVTLPRERPTTAFWQDPPDAAVADLQSTAALPAEVDVVVVGSGITGASIAWHLLGGEEGAVDGDTAAPTPGRPPSVLMLEARQAASGATGRNGGHTKAASYWSFPGHAAAHGTAAAVQIARLELAGVRAVHALAAGKGGGGSGDDGPIPCDSHPCETVDIVYDPDKWAFAQTAIAALRAALPPDDPAAAYRLYDRAEALAAFPCRDHGDHDGARVCGAVRYEAGSISAYRFTAGILRRCVARGLQLHTHTPALELVREAATRGRRWTVRTPRGAVAARHVVLATNAYAARLVPALQGVVVPLRGQIAMHRPPPAAAMLPPSPSPYTYSFVYAAGYDYLVTRPPGAAAAGALVLGGGLAFARSSSETDDADNADGADAEYGTTDDTTLNPGVSAHLHAAPGRYFGWRGGTDGHDGDGTVRAEWTGIMGYTPDGLPLVGAMPGQTADDDGLWLCCAFQGHGMVFSWLCGRAVAAMVRGRDGPALRQWFPDCFRVRPERLRLPFRGRQHGAVRAREGEGPASSERD